MSDIFSDLIREILEPIMVEHGFKAIVKTENSWAFEKKDADIKKKQLVIVENFSEIFRTIRLELSIVPSLKQLYLDLSNIITDDLSLKKSSLGGWEYESTGDMQKILWMIADSMQKKGFEALTYAQNNNESYSATFEEQRDLNENHDSYAESFRLKHQLQDWMPENVLTAIKKELKDFPEKVTEENRQRLLYIAAACGEIFVAKGGRWMWDMSGEYERAIVTIKNHNSDVGGLAKEFEMEPLDLIYQYIHTEHRDNICVWIEGMLTYTRSS